MKSYLREPLVHFVLLGGLLFIGNGLWESWAKKDAYTIRVSPAEIQRQAAIFATENRRAPDDNDLQGLLFAHVEEQVLMREARRIGLDADDTIIKRRLAQKMRFLINDVSDTSLPKEAELKDWFNQNASDFKQPELRSFEHIYISPEGRGATIETEAKAILSGGIGADWKSLGDPFIMSRSFEDVSLSDVTKDFGRDFANGVFTPDRVKAGWQGPIGSAFGLHLIRITNIQPETTPAFADVRSNVEAVWLDRAGREGNAQRLKDLIEKYDVVIDE